MKIAVLAVQGAFVEHERMLAQLGIESFEIRQKNDLQQDFAGLILPGGESTVMGKLVRELDLFEPLKEKIAGGLPVLGTCAGLILLAEKLSNDDNVYFGTLPVTVRRNAYGRQLGSFYTNAMVKGIGKIPMAFIRAPYGHPAPSQVFCGVGGGRMTAWGFTTTNADIFQNECHERLECCRGTLPRWQGAGNGLLFPGLFWRQVPRPCFRQ